MVEPLVSIGMSSWNSAATINSAINSIKSQEYSNWELIIIDANSSDATRNLILEHQKSDARIKSYFCEIQQPWTKSTHQQLEMANGKFFMWLDPDDILSKNWLSTLIAKLSDDRFVCATGVLQLIDNHDNLVINNVSSGRNFAFTASRYRFFRIFSALLLPESFGIVNFLYGLWSIDALRKIKLWSQDDETLTFDQEFVLNALAMGPILYTSETVHYRRTHWSLLEVDNSIKVGSPKAYEVIRINPISYLGELLTIKPTFHLYRNWVQQEKLTAPVYLTAIYFRQILSLVSPLVYRLRNFVRKN